MHPPEVRAHALELVAAGLSDCEISRKIGIPRRTISDWRRRPYERSTFTETCPRCWRVAKLIRFTAEDYSELLGLYLGDGCISELARTQRLRIALDARYPTIIDDTRSILVRSFPDNDVDLVPSIGCIHVSLYCSHLACLFPQHGVGRKHGRRIALEGWQRHHLEAAPWSFLRGCIRSDGCAFINRTGRYEYLSYDFTNKSKDIVDLYRSTCDLVGIRDHRASCFRDTWHVRINRRGSGAKLLEHIGLKA